METMIQGSSVSEVKEEDVTRDFKVVTKNKVRLKHSGIADDFVEASVNGKKIKRYRKKQLFNDNDTVETMEKSTAELLSDSSRKILKKIEKDENKRLNELVERTYSPRKDTKKIDEKKMVKNLINFL